MKICFICNEYPPQPHGGIGVFVQTMAEKLAQLGEDVSVVGYGKRVRGSFTQNGVKVFWISLPNPLYRRLNFRGFSYSPAMLISRFVLSQTLGSIEKQEKFDMVESHDFSGPLAWKPATRLVVRLHGSVSAYRAAEGRTQELHPLEGHYEKRQVQAADHIVAVSEHIGTLTNRVMRLDRAFDVIHNGVDTEVFRPGTGALASKMVLFVGNVMWRKGVFDLIRAAPLVLERHPDTRFVIAGRAGGSHLKQLDMALAELPSNMREHVSLVGQVAHTDLPALYNRAAVFVFPSRVEAFGLTCVEAMACGRPIVATCMASGPELVEDGVSGLLADPTSPEDLAEKVILLLDDSDLARALGMAARKKAVEVFNLDGMGERNLSLYRSLRNG